MRVLLVGSGGREHALAWKISRSPLVEKLWITPGNPGTAQVGENLDLAVDDLDGIVGFARAQGVGLVVVGPEDPLVQGLADRCADAGIPCFGPRADAAELEGSKAFCKEVMIRHRVPTATYRVFSDLNPAISYLQGGARYPLVVKASGLAAGKGVVICEDARQARDAAKAMLEDGAHGAAGRTIVVEDFLDGPEASAFALTDSRTFVPLESCQDHKQLGEGGTGPNTGGMGAVSPNPMMGARTADAVERQVILPTIHGMNHEGRRFQGILFAGLKLTPAGPKVLEYNVRFGDPECQVLMLRLKSDLVPLLLACAEGDLDGCEAPEWDTRPAITVILASQGYPGKYEKGIPIHGLDALETGDDLQVFHAGTALQGDQLVTNGGRVLAVTALGETLLEARDRAYAAVDAIEFEGKTFRRDIGEAALETLRSYQ
ncbi:MAG: phosphoribosylamine--glycine ligase [Planctomycetes bacterium]|nr:phosphoribosylamine--glycine ligase [Planctomycetota bacterium]